MANEMTQEQIAAVDALYAKATPGKWCHGMAHWGRWQIYGGERTVGELSSYAGLGGREIQLNAEQEANVAMISALVNAWPAIRETLLALAPDAERYRKVRETSTQLRTFLCSADWEMEKHLGLPWPEFRVKWSEQLDSCVDAALTAKGN